MRHFHFTLAVLTISALTSSSSAQDLVAHWRLDEASGSVLSDAVGGYDFTLTPGFTLGEAGAAAACGTAVGFDAAASVHGSFASDSMWDGLTSGVTVAVWINVQAPPSVQSNTGRIFGNDNDGWSCGYTSDRLKFTTRFIQDYFSPVTTIPLASYSHFAFVFDDAFDVTFYQDGVELGTAPGGSASSNSAAQWLIGTLDSTGTIDEHIDAVVDDLQVYDGVLDANDVAFLFANPCTPLAGGPIGSNYCLSVTNSTGSAATIGAVGSTSVAANDVLLRAATVPQQPGIFYYGVNQVQLPFGNGFRCVGGTIGRFGFTTPDAAGVLSWTIDITDPPTAGTQITPGSTWNFQAWFRDPAAGGGLFNLSDGLSISFTP